VIGHGAQACVLDALAVGGINSTTRPPVAPLCECANSTAAPTVTSTPAASVGCSNRRHFAQSHALRGRSARCPQFEQVGELGPALTALMA